MPSGPSRWCNRRGVMLRDGAMPAPWEQLCELCTAKVDSCVSYLLHDGQVPSVLTTRNLSPILIMGTFYDLKLEGFVYS